MGRKGKRAKGPPRTEAGSGGQRPDNADAEQKAEAAREAVNWVVRRLNVLEFLILFLASVLALLGGALVGWLLNSSLGLSFRWSWAVASLLLFILPGGFVYLREFRKRGPSPDRVSKSEPKEPHG